MAPATEIALLPLVPGEYPDDAQSAPGKTLRELVEIILAQKGAQKCYWGREVENPDTLRLFVDWDSVDDHKAFIASDQYKPFFKQFGTLMSGDPTLYHVHFDPHPPTVALIGSSPIATENITIYFPTTYSTEDQKAFVDSLNKFVAVIEKTQDISGYKGSVGGWVEEELTVPGSSEKAKGYVCLIAWESVEAHLKYRETQDFKDNSHLLRGAKDLITLRVVHTFCTEA